MQTVDLDMMEMIWDIASDESLSECDRLEIIHAEGHCMENVLNILMMAG